MKRNLLALAPLLAFLVISFLYGIYGFIFLPGTQVVKGKFLWCASAIMFDASILALITVSGLILRRFSPESSKLRWALYASLFAILVLFALGIFIKDVETPAGDDVLDQLQKTEPRLELVLKINNRLAWFAGILMIVIASLLIFKSGTATARELGLRIRYFRAAIYSASALLATGIVEIYQLFKWAEFAATPPPNNAAFFSTFLPVAAGFLFSAFLVAIFLPSAILLDSRYRELMSQAAADSPEFNKENWLLQHDLADSPLRVFSSYLAALLPVAAGLLVKLGERFL